MVMMEVFVVTTVMTTMAVVMVAGGCGWVVDMTGAVLVITTETLGLVMLMTAVFGCGDEGDGDDGSDEGLVDDGSRAHVWGKRGMSVLVIDDGGSVHQPWR